MSLKSLFIIPMMAPLLTSSLVYASELPDEVNYEPYQRSYEQASDQLEIITRDLNNSKMELQDAYSTENNYYTSIQNLEDENLSINNNIKNLQDERYDLEIVLDQLDSKIKRLRNKIRTLENSKAQIQKELKNEQRRLKPFEVKIQAKKQEVKVLRVELEKATKVSRLAKKKRDNIVNSIDKDKKTQKQLQASLKAQNENLKSIDTKISNATTQIAKIKTKKDAAVKTQNTATQKLTALRAQATEIQLTMRTIVTNTPGGPRAAMRLPEYQKAIRELRAKNIEIKEQAKVEVAAKKVTQNITRQYNSAVATKNNLVKEKTQLPAKISATKAAIKKNKTKITNAEASFAAAEIAYQSSAVVVLEKQTELKTTGARLSALEQKLANESIKKDKLINRLSKTQEELNNNSHRLTKRSQEYNSAINRSNDIDSIIPNLRRNHRRNIGEIRRVNTSLVTIQDSIIQLNSDVTILSSEQGNAARSKDLKYQEYISRYEYYGEKLAQAKTIGASQTDTAISIAMTDSNAYVELRSSSLAKQIGVELANAQSNLWAAVRAEVNGYNDGYQSGYSSEEDELRGSQEGTTAGINSAKDYADTVLKPKFFKADYSDALKGMTKNLVKSIATVFVENQLELSNKNISSFSNAVLGVSPISESELSESYKVSTDLDISISSFMKNLEQISAQNSNYAQPGNVYQTPQSIPFQAVDCSSVYKDISEFISACEREYTGLFESKYLSEYSENFNAQYTSAYQEKLEAKRAQTISKIYQEDYERFYPIGKVSGLSDGKAQIFEEAYALAKDNAYNNEIPKATSVAKATASNEVREWISNNAAITVTSSKIEGDNLQGGTSANISIQLKNISPKDLTKPVKIVITKTRNAIVQNKNIYVQQAAGNSTTEFKDINFKVDSNARSNETISIEGQVILPGGKYETERVETFKVSSVAALNPAIKTDIDYDSTPKIKGWRSYYIHKIDVEMTPEVENIPAGYTVELIPSQEAKDLVQITDSNATTGKLVYGKTSEVTFKYRLKKKADGKKLKLDVRYMYKGKLIKVNVLEIEPH